jgi:hypothetical protein
VLVERNAAATSSGERGRMAYDDPTDGDDLSLLEAIVIIVNKTEDEARSSRADVIPSSAARSAGSGKDWWCLEPLKTSSDLRGKVE